MHICYIFMCYDIFQSNYFALHTNTYCILYIVPWFLNYILASGTLKHFCHPEILVNVRFHLSTLILLVDLQQLFASEIYFLRFYHPKIFSLVYWICVLRTSEGQKQLSCFNFCWAFLTLFIFTVPVRKMLFGRRNYAIAIPVKYLSM